MTDHAEPARKALALIDRSVMLPLALKERLRAHIRQESSLVKINQVLAYLQLGDRATGRMLETVSKSNPPLARRMKAFLQGQHGQSLLKVEQRHHTENQAQAEDILSEL